MERFLLGLSDAFAEAPNRVLRYKSFVLTGLVVISLLLSYGVFTRTSMDMSLDSYLNEADPAISALANVVSRLDGKRVGTRHFD